MGLWFFRVWYALFVVNFWTLLPTSNFLATCEDALLSQHFGKDNRYHKLFNRNTVKLSYSCMPNMIIKSHNARLLSKGNGNRKACSCRNKIQCPLDGNCMQTFLVYEAEVITEAEKFRYIGLCEGDFKTRFNTHKSTFRNLKYCYSTELSKRICARKDTNVEYAVNWKILQTPPARRCGSSRCRLCLSEKHHIITAKKANLLNKCNELMSKCCHINNHLLTNTIFLANKLYFLCSFVWLYVYLSAHGLPLANTYIPH